MSVTVHYRAANPRRGVDHTKWGCLWTFTYTIYVLNQDGNIKACEWIVSSQDHT